MASTYLSTTSTSATLATKYTISFWIKKAIAGADMRIFNQYADANNTAAIYFDASNDYLNIVDKLSSSTHLDISTTRKFRDSTAWMHIVIAADTTQSTAADRLKVYINGTQETSFATSTYPSQDASLGMQTVSASGQRRIGSHNGGGDYLDGSLAHFHFIDGLAYPASTFGETDSTSGIWKPKASPSVTYGNNGFFLKFENSGNLDLDSSGNNLTFTTSGTLTQNIDTPSNNFVTMNPLDNYYNPSTFTNGNTTVTTPSSGYSGVIGAMGASKGKWYFEFKPVSKTGDADEYSVGIAGASVTSTNQPHWKLSTGYEYLGVNGNYYNNDSGTSYGNTFTAGDIIGVAMDLDNSKLYFSKNGTFQNSGVPTSGSTGTGAISITAPDSTPIGFYLPCCAFTSNSAGATMSFNFGSGYFGTTAVSSGNADANGYGSMEYTVPTGYYTMCTKNIKEFG